MSSSSTNQPGQPSPESTPAPVNPAVAIQTVNGNYLTVVDNGGLTNTLGFAVAITANRTTVGPDEKFTQIPVSTANGTIALRTRNGRNYVTAVGGGGMGGSNLGFYPIHTDATRVGPWETLTIEPQSDGTLAFRTSTGFYLSAVNGGGVGDYGSNTMPIHTDATAIGPWETFTLVSAPIPITP